MPAPLYLRARRRFNGVLYGVNCSLLAAEEKATPLFPASMHPRKAESLNTNDLKQNVNIDILRARVTATSYWPVV